MTLRGHGSRLDRVEHWQAGPHRAHNHVQRFRKRLDETLLKTPLRCPKVHDGHPNSGADDDRGREYDGPIEVSEQAGTERHSETGCGHEMPAFDPIPGAAQFAGYVLQNASRQQS
jgi:hypothetical protein